MPNTKTTNTYGDGPVQRRPTELKAHIADTTPDAEVTEASVMAAILANCANMANLDNQVFGGLMLDSYAHMDTFFIALYDFWDDVMTKWNSLNSPYSAIGMNITSNAGVFGGITPHAKAQGQTVPYTAAQINSDADDLATAGSGGWLGDLATPSFGGVGLMGTGSGVTAGHDVADWYGVGYLEL